MDRLVADMSAYLDLIETIDKKLGAFKAKYEKLRDQAIKEHQDRWQLERKESREKLERARAKAKEKKQKSKGKKKQESSSESSSENSDEESSSSSEEEKK